MTLTLGRNHSKQQCSGIAIVQMLRPANVPLTMPLRWPSMLRPNSGEEQIWIFGLS
jgi:hypothetical protein